MDASNSSHALLRVQESASTLLDDGNNNGDIYEAIVPSSACSVLLVMQKTLVGMKGIYISARDGELQRWVRKWEFSWDFFV